MREAINNPGIMCPVRVVDNPGMVISHTCIECTTSPLGRFMDKGFVIRQKNSMGVPTITKTEVVPVSAMACVGGNETIFLVGRADAIICGHDMFEAMTVASLQIIYMGSGVHIEILQLI
jgi:hypothetical protein